MQDLELYINKRKKTSAEFASSFDIGYENFKFGVMLKSKEARKDLGLTKTDLTERIKTQKNIVS